MFTRVTRGLAATALILALPACDSEGDGGDPGEQEFITQVNVMLTPSSGGTTQMLQFDFDEEGNLTDSPDRVTLTPGVTYNGTIQLLDTVNDEDITEEIEEEAEEHLFAYSLSPSGAGTVTITDSESDYTTDNENGGDFRVGLEFDLAVASSASGNGTMTAILYHFDDDPKTSSTATSDEIDVEVSVPLSFSGVLARR